MKKIIFLFVLLSFCEFTFVQLTENQLDSLVQKTLKTFNVPGISVGIIENGKVVYAKGQGVRSLTNKKPMNNKTLVGIASNSKGFTCFALAMLVDEGKLHWDDKVRKHIPVFKLSNEYLTEEFTIRDLVTHRSGLSLCAGDLMFFPEGNNMAIDDILKGISVLKPGSYFRSEFRYNNNMFNIVGEVIKRVSGLEWADFVEQRIIRPVGMKSTKASYNRIRNNTNIIDAHVSVDGEIKQIPHDWSELANPAGGIISNIDDMLIWAEFLMKGGITKDGKRLISEQQMHELWTLQTPMKVSENNPYNTHFKGYGLGWFLSDAGGAFEVTHSGGLLGTVTKFTLFPEKNIGIVILTNQQSRASFSVINNAIRDSYLGYGNRDWIEKYSKRVKDYFAKVKEDKDKIYATAKTFVKSGCIPAKENILGNYKDAWLGRIFIKEKDKKLWITFENQPALVGELIPYNMTTYIAKWSNRSFDADAFLLFTFDENGKSTGFTMKPISDVTDSSFDFVDLDVKRVD